MKDKKKTNSIWKKVLVFLLISAILLPSIPVPNGIMASSYQPENANTFSEGTTEGDDWTDESVEQGSSDGIDAEESDNEESDVDENPADVTNPDVEFSDGSSAEETDTTPSQDTNEETEGDDFQGENETDFTDGENSETNPPEEDDLETEEETSGPESLVYEDGSIRLTASCCEEGAIPQGTVLQVEAIEKEKSSTALTYQGAEEKLSEKAQAQWYELQGFLAYDIAFVDEQGNKQQPNGSVRLTLEYKPNAVPSTVSQPETCIISAAELSQDDFGQVTQVTELTSGEITTLETTANGKVQKLDFVKNRLAAFAIVWNSEVSGEPDEEEEITPTPTPDEEEEITPTPTPDGEEEITPTPMPDGEEEITPTPTPDGEEEITPTPTPDVDEEITPTPTPDVDEELTPTPTPDVDEELTPTPTPELEGLVYEDGNVKAVLNAAEWEIPEGASLRVTALADEDETAFWMNEQITSKLTEESEDGENHISGFLAYEIAIEDELGNEIEPEGQIFVSIQYKEGVLPEALREAEMTNSEISLWQLETDEEGLPVQMVNMKDNGTLTNLSTTESQEILEAEFAAEQLTSYAAVWTDTQEPKQEEPEVSEYLEYEDDSVKVVVSAVEEGAIPEGSTLKVVPVLPEDEQTAEKYTETKAKLQEKAESEEFQVIGFLAYDITFVDEEGNKVEPSGQVQVSMEYKEAAVPEAVKGEAAETAEVTVLHLEEDENGEVTQVVDMGKSNQLTNVETTETKEIEKAEFVTDSFSVFTIIWSSGSNPKTVFFNYVDEDGNGLPSIPGMKGEISLKDDVVIEFPSEKYTPYIYGDSYVYTFQNAYMKGDSKPIYGIKGSNNGIKYDRPGETWWDWARANNVYELKIVYKKEEIPQPGNSDKLGAPEHKKYIKYNQEEDNYTLTLDVTGKVEEEGVDVLLVLDRSDSMNFNNNNLLDKLKTSVKDIAGTILPESNQINRLSFVSFSDYDSRNGDLSQNWTFNKEDIVNEIGKLKGNGYTNWQYAVRQADKKMNELNDSTSTPKRKFVIFISDGYPTESFTSLNGFAKETNKEYFPEYEIHKHLLRAVQQFYNSASLCNSTIYSMYLNDEAELKMQEFAKLVGGIAVDGRNMEDALKDIANAIVAPSYKNVSIEDTLSEYVEFAEDTPEFSVTARDQNGFTETLVSDKDYTLNYSTQNKTIKLELKNDPLENGTTYSISFLIKPSEKAKEEFAQRGEYFYKGDEGTDAEDNYTSSNQPGFYSNKQAIVRYQENDKPQRTSDYAKPVVQVKAVTLNIKKEWVDEENSTHAPVYVGLYKKSETETEVTPISDKYIRLTDGEGWSGSFQRLSILNDGSQYIVKELREVEQGDEIEFTIDGQSYVGIEAGGTFEQNDKKYTVSYEQPDNSQTEEKLSQEVIITNTLVKDGIEIAVEKIWEIPDEIGEIEHDPVWVGLFKDGELIRGQDDKEVVVALTSEEKWTHIFQYEISQEEYEKGNYTVKEVVKKDENFIAVDENKFVKISDKIEGSKIENLYQVTYEKVNCDETERKATFRVRNKLILGSVEITKKDSNDNKLEGAGFQIKGATNGTVDTGISGQEGILKFESLLPGEYTITEVKSPAGYSLLINPIKVTIGTTEGTSENGYEVVGGDGKKFYYDLKLDVVNNKLFDMPEGGGTGTQGIVFAGIFMMLAAGGYGLTLRKRKRQTIRR